MKAAGEKRMEKPTLGRGGCLSLSQLTSGHPGAVAEETDNHSRSHLVCNQPAAFEMWEETGVLGENPCRPGKNPTQCSDQPKVDSGKRTQVSPTGVQCTNLCATKWIHFPNGDTVFNLA
ncbi:uncharacterized protein LOC144198293 [Stigmatopora nigra]